VIHPGYARDGPGRRHLLELWLDLADEQLLRQSAGNQHQRECVSARLLPSPCKASLSDALVQTTITLIDALALLASTGRSLTSAPHLESGTSVNWAKKSFWRLYNVILPDTPTQPLIRCVSGYQGGVALQTLLPYAIVSHMVVFATSRAVTLAKFVTLRTMPEH
jgi:hypothetical protein